MTYWERKKHLFTEDEHAELTGAVTGQAICPRGLFIDTDKLKRELKIKLLTHISDAAVGK